MEPHAIRGNTAQRPIAGVDHELKALAVFGNAPLAKVDPVSGENDIARRNRDIRGIQLQDEAGVDNRPVLDVHRVGDRIEISLEGGVDTVALGIGNHAWSCRGKERFAVLDAC